jgi:hypothetical protein
VRAIDSVTTAVVRIGHLGIRAVTGKIKKQPDFVAVCIRCLACQDFHIIQVHREYVVVLFEVLRVDRPGANIVQFEAPPGSSLHGAAVRRGTPVIGMRTGRIRSDSLGETGLNYQLAKYAFRRR